MDSVSRRNLVASIALGTGLGFDPRSARSIIFQGADLGAGTSARQLRFTSLMPGAVTRTVEEKLLDTLSVKDFGATGDGTADDTDAFQKALATGLNVFVPAGIYLLSRTIELRSHGQALFGEGNYTTELRWVGEDPTVNVIEFRSVRTATSPHTTRSGMQLRCFVISSSTAACCANVIWQQNGCFHTFVEKIRSAGSSTAGFLGRVKESFIRIEGTGQSYCVHPTFRDVVITGVSGGGAADPAQPCGFWVEGAIEGMFDNCFSYGFEECWRLGTPTVANARNVQNCRFVNCLGEIGDRSGLSDNAASLRIYFASNCIFYGCKFDAGEGWGSATNQTPIRLSGVPGFVTNQVAFHGCAIWGFGYCNYGIVVEDSATDIRGISFKECDFNGFLKGLVFTTGTVDPVIRLPLDQNFFTDAIPTTGRMLCRSAAYSAPSLANGAGETVTLMAELYGPDDVPLLTSLSDSQQGMFLTAYRNNTAGAVVLRLQNETGGLRDPVSAKARMRMIERDEIKAMATAIFDPSSIAPGAQVVTTLWVPGATIGDFVSVAFKNAQANNLAGITLGGHVSADHTVTAIFYNGTERVINLSPGSLRAVILQPIFDLAGAAIYDPGVLAEDVGDTASVPVIGASLGDFVVTSFTNGLEGALMQGHVSATNTVSVRMHNGTGLAMKPGAGTILVGVYKRASAI